MSPMSPGSHFIWMWYTSSRSMHYVSPLSPGSHQASTPFTFSYFGRSRSHVSHRSHYMNHAKIYPFPDVSCPQWALAGSHFISISYTSSRSMHYVSPLSAGSQQASTPFTSSYFGRSRSPVSHRSHYINHVKIYPFSDILSPQWAPGATLYQCHVLPTVQCAMWPHWAPGPPYFIILYIWPFRVFWVSSEP